MSPDTAPCLGPRLDSCIVLGPKIYKDIDRCAALWVFVENALFEIRKLEGVVSPLAPPLYDTPD